MRTTGSIVALFCVVMLASVISVISQDKPVEQATKGEYVKLERMEMLELRDLWQKEQLVQSNRNTIEVQLQALQMRYQELGKELQEAQEKKSVMMRELCEKHQMDANTTQFNTETGELTKIKPPENQR